MLAHHGIMRTTLDIDDDVLRAAKELAQRERVSAGQVVSRLLRQAMTASGSQGPVTPVGVAGFRPFSSPNPQVVTNEQVNALRDQDDL
jgi:ribose 1,5-bisphosphokinase PhnN